MTTRDLKIEFHRIPQTIAVIREWFSPEELELVWSELDVLCSPFLLRPPEETGTAHSREDQSLLKKGHGLFLDNIYNGRREVSHILNIGRRVFTKEFNEVLAGNDPNFRHISACDNDWTLVNYYEGGDEYKSHTDQAIYTANIVLWREPKKFDGGKFILEKDERDLEIGHNDMVIFPGYTPHAVTPMTMHEDYTPWKSGRYSIANFCSYR